MSEEKVEPEQKKDEVPPGPVVVFKDVSLSFEGKDVLKQISFQVERGQTLCILGPAGTGKSVLMSW